MGHLDIVRSTLVNIGYIAYYVLLCWSLRTVLKSENEYSDEITLPVAIGMVVLFGLVQTGVCWFQKKTFLNVLQNNKILEVYQDSIHDVFTKCYFTV